MARKKADPVSLKPLSEDDIKTLRSGVEDIEKFKTRADQANADARAAADRLAEKLAPLGYEKEDIAALIGRRKKDRARVTAKDIRVRKLEVALGMTTADMFDDAATTLQAATTADEAIQASLEAGNAAAKLDQAKGKAAATKPAAAPAPEASDADAEKIRAEGRAAFARGAGDEACKYPANSRARILWTQGWDESREDWEKDNADMTGKPLSPAAAAPKGKDYLAAVGADL